jgi:predicted PurR-regulated permease PerM|tara:strand:- start:94386 stop:95666 length:1281 start_codon:yes stop_codon:yes gene_type:complete
MANDQDQNSDSNTSSEIPQSSYPLWSRLHLWQMQPVRDVLLGLGIFALILMGQKASVVTVPLLLAVLFAYLFEPVIVWSMKKLNIARRTSVSGIIAIVVLLVILPSAIGASYGIAQTISFAQHIITNIDKVQQAQEVPDIELAHQQLEEQGVGGAWISIHDSIRSADDENSPVSQALLAANNWILENKDEVASTATTVGLETINRILSFLGAVFGLGFMGFLTAFFFFFLATEWVGVKGFGANLLPDKNRDRIIDLLTKFDAVISGFIRGRLTIAFIQAIVFSIGFFAIGVPGAFILGPAVAFLSIVPYLALVGVPIAVSLLWLQGYSDIRGEWWWVVGAPTILYFVGQALDDYVLTPLIQGKSTGMDTPTILFASLAGGALFGVFGLLIAIPIAACVKILIQEIFWPKFKDWAEGRASDPLPIEN